MTSSSASAGSAAVAGRALGLLDLTSLGVDDTADDIDTLCAAARTPHGPVAAVCVWPRFVARAVDQLADSGVRVCAVANFPAGDDDVERAVAEARAIVDQGGHEVDVVVPWRAFAEGSTGVVERLVAGVRAELPESIVLKAILETGEIDPSLVASVAREALDGGADFLKTSTGKTATSATPEAAAALLGVLADRRTAGGRGDDAGLKVSGGVRDLATASRYLGLADAAMGPDWADARHFRFGASGLLNDLLTHL